MKNDIQGDKSIKQLKLESKVLSIERKILLKERGKILKEEKATIASIDKGIDVIYMYIIKELRKKGVADLKGKEELTSFLKNYSKENYARDIQPIIIDALLKKE